MRDYYSSKVSGVRVSYVFVEIAIDGRHDQAIRTVPGCIADRNLTFLKVSRFFVPSPVSLTSREILNL